MPDSLEFIVRPFQTPSAHGRAIIAATPKGTRENATLTWGGKATLQDVKSNERSGVDVICCRQDHVETYRTGVVREVRNSTKPSVPPSFGYGGEFPDLRAWFRTPVSVTLQKKEKQSCTGEWEQMSGVASAIKNLFADLAADLKAGRGDDPTPCKTTFNFNV